MYTIEYYKTKREKSTIEEPDYSSDNKKINYMMRRRYLHQKDLIDRCWNIKSLTIDMEDINHIIQDRRLHTLFSLYASVKRVNFDESVDSITIRNNNSINSSYIYEIINCQWMVNANEELNNLDVLDMVRKLVVLIEKYDKVTEQKTKRNIKDEIELIKYYVNTIINKYNNKASDTKDLDLGQYVKTKRNY